MQVWDCSEPGNSCETGSQLVTTLIKEHPYTRTVHVNAYGNILFCVNCKGVHTVEKVGSDLLEELAVTFRSVRGSHGLVPPEGLH